jgi:hypothetical protein
MTTRLSLLAIPCLAAVLLPAALAQGGAQPQPTDPTAQSPATPAQTTPPTFPEPGPTQTPDAQAPQSSSSAANTSDAGRMFAGSIVRQKSAYVLKSGNTAYKLDNQTQAKEYKGKNVKVTGSLDTSTNTIHVEKIEPATAM